MRCCPPLPSLLPLLFLALSPALAAPTARADDSFAVEKVRSWAGEYRHAGGAAEEAALAALIDHMALGFNVLLRPIARSRLEKTVVVPTRIEIELESTGLSVQVIGAPDLPDDPVLEDGAIVVRQSNFEGSRETTFRLDDDGRVLTMQVRTSSKLLRDELRYQLTFERVGGSSLANGTAPGGPEPPSVSTAGELPLSGSADEAGGS